MSNGLPLPCFCSEKIKAEQAGLFRFYFSLFFLMGYFLFFRYSLTFFSMRAARSLSVAFTNFSPTMCS